MIDNWKQAGEVGSLQDNGQTGLPSRTKRAVPKPPRRVDQLIQSAIQEFDCSGVKRRPFDWQRPAFNLARSLKAIPEVRARWDDGEREFLIQMFETWFQMHSEQIDELAEECGYCDGAEFEVMLDQFLDVAFPGARIPAGQPGETWKGVIERAQATYRTIVRREHIDPEPVAAEIIRRHEYRTPGLKLTACIVVELQMLRITRKGEARAFPLSGYKLAEELARLVPGTGQRETARFLQKLEFDGVVECTSRGEAGTRGRGRASEYRLTAEWRDCLT